MMLEAGQSEARALADIDEAKKLMPTKPIRYVVNTHPHADHTGGLPAMVAEGATIVTPQNNERFFVDAFNTPRTLLNDRLATTPKKAKIAAVAEKKVYTDGTRVVELHHVAPVRRRCSFRATSRCRRPDSRPTITSRPSCPRSRS